MIVLKVIGSEAMSLNDNVGDNVVSKDHEAKKESKRGVFGLFSLNSLSGSLF